MAACDLDPSKRESLDSTSCISHSEQNTPCCRAVVLTMVEFAAAMMMQLQNFNRGSFQSFEGLNLRIGKTFNCILCNLNFVQLFHLFQLH